MDAYWRKDFLVGTIVRTVGVGTITGGRFVYGVLPKRVYLTHALL